MKRILVAAPVRNRAWILPSHLRAVAALVTPYDVELDFLYIVNGSTDATRTILERFAATRPSRNRVTIVDWPEAAPAKDTRNTSDRVQLYRYLAALRNATLDAAIDGGYDYLFSCDVDILPPRDALCRLIEADKPLVSAVICNDSFYDLPPNRRTHNLMRIEPGLTAPGGGPVYLSVNDFPPEPVPVDVTGAIMLARRDLLTSGARFGDHLIGEDVPFCESARQRGFTLWAHGGVRAQHIMSPADLLLPPFLRASQTLRGGTFWVNAIETDRGPVREATLAPSITARVLAGLFTSQLAHVNPDLINLPIQSFAWDMQTNSVKIRYGPPPPAAQPKAPRDRPHNVPPRHQKAKRKR